MKLLLVVNGNLLVEKKYRKEETYSIFVLFLLNGFIASRLKLQMQYAVVQVAVRSVSNIASHPAF